jgi:hypothetical protein
MQGVSLPLCARGVPRLNVCRSHPARFAAPSPPFLGDAGCESAAPRSRRALGAPRPKVCRSRHARSAASPLLPCRVPRSCARKLRRRALANKDTRTEYANCSECNTYCCANMDSITNGAKGSKLVCNQSQADVDTCCLAFNCAFCYSGSCLTWCDTVPCGTDTGSMYATYCGCPGSTRDGCTATVTSGQNPDFTKQNTGAPCPVPAYATRPAA